MIHNEHSLKVWSLIQNFAFEWNVNSWIPFTERTVAFTVKLKECEYAIGISELIMGNHQMFIIGYKLISSNDAIIKTIVSADQLVSTIDNLNVPQWRAGNIERVIGERAPQSIRVCVGR